MKEVELEKTTTELVNLTIISEIRRFLTFLAEKGISIPHGTMKDYETEFGNRLNIPIPELGFDDYYTNNKKCSDVKTNKVN